MTIDGVSADCVEAWVSTNDGMTWSETEIADFGRGAYRYLAPADGRFSFYFVLTNDAGASGSPPDAGCAPMASVIVDTTSPTIQIRGVRRAPGGSEHDVEVRLALVDENLGPDGVRVFHRQSGAGWRDGGVAVVDAGLVRWNIPSEVSGAFDLRVIATDLAGNQASDEKLSVQLSSESANAPDVPPRESIQVASSSRPSGLTGHGTIPLAGSPFYSRRTRSAQQNSEAGGNNASEARAKSQGQEAVSLAVMQSSAGNGERASRLRDQAARFLEEERFDLAVARLEAALREQPDDVETLCALGAALVRGHRYAEANDRFAAARARNPDQTAALDGLALVAAAQKQYSQARSYLKRLLELMPDSGRTWLRYGDVEYRLGNTREAVAAWRRALDGRDADIGLRDSARRRIAELGK